MSEYRPAHDPFTPPASRLRGDAPPHARNAAAAGAWIDRGFRLYTASPGPWVGIALAYLALQVVLTSLPLVGSLVSSLLGPVLQAGILLGCAAQAKTGRMRFAALFCAFSHPLLGRLVALGAASLGIYLLAFMSIFLLFALLFGATLLSADGGAADAIASGDPEALASLFGVLAGSGLSLMVVGLLGSVVLFIATAALWLAPARIVLAGATITDALTDSLVACLRAWPAMLLYVPCMLGLLFIACLPLFLGLLVFVPLFFASQYAAHEDMFADSSSKPVATAHDH